MLSRVRGDGQCTSVQVAAVFRPGQLDFMFLILPGAFWKIISKEMN